MHVTCMHNDCMVRVRNFAHDILGETFADLYFHSILRISKTRYDIQIRVEINVWKLLHMQYLNG